MTSTRTQDSLRAAIAKVDALLNPRNVVIVGATDKPGNWPQRVWRNLQRYGFEGAVFPLNPDARQRVGHALLSLFRGTAREARSSRRAGARENASARSLRDAARPARAARPS